MKVSEKSLKNTKQVKVGPFSANVSVRGSEYSGGKVDFDNNGSFEKINNRMVTGYRDCVGRPSL